MRQLADLLSSSDCPNFDTVVRVLLQSDDNTFRATAPAVLGVASSCLGLPASARSTIVALAVVEICVCPHVPASLNTVRDRGESPRIPLRPSQHTVCPYVRASLNTIHDRGESPRIALRPSQHTVCPYVPASLNTVRDRGGVPQDSSMSSPTHSVSLCPQYRKG